MIEAEKKLTAIIADEHPLMIQATVALLDKIGNVTVLDVVSSCNQCLIQTKLHWPDLIILEYKIKDMDPLVLREIKELSPQTKVIIFTGASMDQIAPEVLAYSDGVVSKNEGHEAVKQVFSCAMNGYFIIPQSIQKHITFPARLVEIELTEVEALIMNLILKGHTLEKIAEEVFISKRSVDNYQKRIFQKLGVTNRAQAIELFMKSKYYKQ